MHLSLNLTVHCIDTEHKKCVYSATSLYFTRLLLPASLNLEQWFAALSLKTVQNCKGNNIGPQNNETKDIIGLLDSNKS